MLKLQDKCLSKFAKVLLKANPGMDSQDYLKALFDFEHDYLRPIYSAAYYEGRFDERKQQEKDRPEELQDALQLGAAAGKKLMAQAYEDGLNRNELISENVWQTGFDEGYVKGHKEGEEAGWQEHKAVMRRTVTGLGEELIMAIEKQSNA